MFRVYFHSIPLYKIIKALEEKHEEQKTMPIYYVMRHHIRSMLMRRKA